MRRKTGLLLAALGCISLLSACGDGRDPGEGIARVTPCPIEGEKIPEESPDADGSGESPEENPVLGYPSEDASDVEQDSSLGYTMTYDPSVFTLDDTGDADRFIYNTAEKLDAPVYLIVQAYPDMDAGVLAEGLVLQSGGEEVSTEDVSLGRDHAESRRIYMEKAGEKVTQTQTFYVLSSGEGSLLVEVGGYMRMPENIEEKFEKMLESFCLKTE